MGLGFYRVYTGYMVEGLKVSSSVSVEGLTRRACSLGL